MPTLTIHVACLACIFIVAPILSPFIDACCGADVYKDEDGRPIGVVFKDENAGLAISRLDGASVGSIKWVFFQRGSVHANDIESLSVLSGIESLAIGCHPDTVEVHKNVLRRISANRTLRKLSIYGPILDDQNFGILSHMRRLEELVLENQAIADQKDLDAIATIDNLKKLSIDCDFEISNFDWLLNLSSLESLSISALSIDQAHLGSVLDKLGPLKVSVDVLDKTTASGQSKSTKR